jgi:hypothetical protein
MKIQTLALAAAIAFAGTATTHAQVSTTGDPAANSQNSKKDTTGLGPSRSGSGTSTSGGRDDNGDQGRDRMPASNMDVKEQPGKPNIANPGAR